MKLNKKTLLAFTSLVSLSFSSSYASAVDAKYIACLDAINSHAKTKHYETDFTVENLDNLFLVLQGKSKPEIEQLLKDNIEYTVLATSLLTALEIEEVPGLNRFAIKAGKKLAASRDHALLAQFVADHLQETDCTLIEISNTIVTRGAQKPKSEIAKKLDAILSEMTDSPAGRIFQVRESDPSISETPSKTAEAALEADGDAGTAEAKWYDEFFEITQLPNGKKNIPLIPRNTPAEEIREIWTKLRIAVYHGIAKRIMKKETRDTLMAQVGLTEEKQIPNSIELNIDVYTLPIYEQRIRELGGKIGERTPQKRERIKDGRGGKSGKSGKRG